MSPNCKKKLANSSYAVKFDVIPHDSEFLPLELQGRRGEQKDWDMLQDCVPAWGRGTEVSTAAI